MKGVFFSPSVLGGWSVAKNGGSEPYARGTLLNRGLKIVRHAHGKHLHTDTGQLSGGDPIAQLANPAKKGPSCFWLCGEGRYGHQPLNLQMRPAGRRLEQLPNFRGIRVYPALGCLAANVDLNQHY